LLDKFSGVHGQQIRPVFRMTKFELEISTFHKTIFRQTTVGLCRKAPPHDIENSDYRQGLLLRLRSTKPFRSSAN